jgi:probable rRNA maturation factor
MILNRQTTVRVARQPLERFVQRVRGELALREADVTICLVSDAEIARMNETFRKKKGPTDVLSFPSGARRGASRKRIRSQHGEYLGDIAISPAVARRNAKQYGHTLHSEMKILVLHGLLHLLGYDHETDRGQMNRLEQRLRRRLGLA